MTEFVFVCSECEHQWEPEELAKTETCFNFQYKLDEFSCDNCGSITAFWVCKKTKVDMNG